MEIKEFKIHVTLAIDKTFTMATNNYEVLDDGTLYPCNMKEYVEQNFVLPNNLADFINSLISCDLNVKNIPKPTYLLEALNDCSNWNITDFECVPDE
jgi:hypothetical protein